MVEESGKTRLGSENDEEGGEEIEEWRKKWLKHYSPHHQILLVGEGDFSFSSSLASAFGSASNVTATSLDHYDALIKMYKKANSNLEKLRRLGASLMHGVDATRMKFHAYLSMGKFDRIIFNFPHAGFHGREDNILMINMHRKLMDGFFHNASQMLRADGEVHVSHKTNAPFCHWKLEELASCNSLKLINQTAFERENYSGYHNKRGDGWKCDESFPLEPCSTFKFRFYPGAREVLRESLMRNNGIHGKYRQIDVSPVQMPVEFPPINERSVQVHVGSERIYKKLVPTQEQSLPLSFGPFPSMTHVPLPRNTHVQLGMNCGEISNTLQLGMNYGEISNTLQLDNYGEISNTLQLGMNYGGISNTHARLGMNYGGISNTHVQLGMNNGGISAYHRHIKQEIPQRTSYDDAGFRSVPLPGLASEQHYADVERSIGDLHLFQHRGT